MKEQDIKINLLDSALAIHTVLNKAEQRIRHLEYDIKTNKNCLFQMQEVAKENNKCLDNLKHVVNAQGQKGTWDMSPYMCGLYNGLEMALAIFEKREPKYREIPNVVGGQKPIIKEKYWKDDGITDSYSYITNPVMSKEIL